VSRLPFWDCKGRAALGQGKRLRQSFRVGWENLADEHYAYFILKREERACELASKNVSLGVPISNALMEDLSTENLDSPKPRGEEFPIEEFEGVPDWNARAWERIQARGAEALKKRLSLAKFLAGCSMRALEGTYAVLDRQVLTEGGDVELRDAIAAEIERRVNSGNFNEAQ